ncbi:transporter substrate-binding domain-containing protein [Kaistia dalseonensis]|uniref:Polar amino acid transport system substrate-binding protein n=1 Tax=Kaistia dalseonensis TaxID=410840 RepID=A0ABU0H199_9HYPH|nr:transporter substrate-binding domain-containing protein [Kaistia dalseonensis]MCX5493250.1 transporter substrate-binding domain-containing protein [Kaistia dalseonensis]MDQ0435807.1 polar amino acid transport system substrate-binding protein [Kaistia dalseonensis]
MRLRLICQILALLMGFLPLAASVAHAASDIPTLQMDPALNAMLPDDIRASGVLTVATDAHYPPCEFFAEDGKTIIGFEPDVWTAIAQKLGLKVEASSIDFGGIIPGVQSKRTDAAFACLSDRPEREEVVTFINFWYGAAAIYAVEANSKITEDPLSLCGLKTAVQTGIDFGDMVRNIFSKHCVANGKPPIEVSEFPAASQVLLALYSNRIDFALSDAAAVDDIQKQATQPIKVIESPLLPKIYLGAIVDKSNTKLAEAMLAALKAVYAEGVYDKIVDKWNLHLLKLAEPGINLASTRPIKTPE